MKLFPSIHRRTVSFSSSSSRVFYLCYVGYCFSSSSSSSSFHHLERYTSTAAFTIQSSPLSVSSVSSYTSSTSSSSSIPFLIHHQQHHHQQQQQPSRSQSLLQLNSSPNPNQDLNQNHNQNQNQNQSSSPPPLTLPNDDDDIQWNLFRKYHVPNDDITQWYGNWTTYDYMGDIMDCINHASIQFTYHPTTQTITQTHEIPIPTRMVELTQSDCTTCHDGITTTSTPSQVQRIPIGSYTIGNLGNYRCASIGMVCGPTILKSSGSMSTELILSHGNGRLRVIYQQYVCVRFVCFFIMMMIYHYS